MSELPNCPKCGESYTYEDGHLYVCPMCAHEWSAADAETAEGGLVVRDANGNLLQDGDSVTIIKDLKVKGASVLKQGTVLKIFASLTAITTSIVKSTASAPWL